MSREQPPRSDIPRNLSFIAALTERAYYRSQRPSLEEEPEEELGEGGTRLGARPRAHAPSRGRRARSAPAVGGGARAPRSRSPDTRKRVRFADALGLELAVVRRFQPGELPRVPRHVQVQLQRDALRHFAPCQPRARSLQEARAALEPACEPGFAARLQAQCICLERVEAGPLGVAGSARVLDLAYEKRVSVRWSADGWRSQREALAAYAGPAPPPPRADRFAFRLPAPPVGGALLFALRYRVTGHEFWDNNGGRPSCPPRWHWPLVTGLTLQALQSLAVTAHWQGPGFEAQANCSPAHLRHHLPLMVVVAFELELLRPQGLLAQSCWPRRSHTSASCGGCGSLQGLLPSLVRRVTVANRDHHLQRGLEKMGLKVQLLWAIDCADSVTAVFQVEATAPPQ